MVTTEVRSRVSSNTSMRFKMQPPTEYSPEEALCQALSRVVVRLSDSQIGSGNEGGQA